MRENTRCEVEDPISTPTLRTTISSSSTSERPVLEKKMRPPSASSSVMSRSCGTPEAEWMAGSPSRAHELRHDRALLVEFWLHAARHAFCLELGLVFGADEGVLHPIRDRGAAFGDVHGRVVDMLLAWRPGLAAGIVRAEPGGQPQRVFRCAEVLVIPARAPRRRRHHPDRLIVHALDPAGMALPPPRAPVARAPGIGIALAPEAD